MIDFPAAPVDGQIFNATNGVVYKYSATYTSWLAQSATPPLGGTGDFYAYNSTVISSFGPGSATLIPDTVLTGNAGLWYSTSTGRYTPPAGRYLIMGGATQTALSGGSNATVQIRKNGVALGTGRQTAQGGQVLNTTGFYGDPQGSVIVDANGADYFDLFATTGVGPTQMGNYWFAAFPLTGMQGPTGGAPGPVVGDFYAYNVAGNLGGSNPAIVGNYSSVSINTGGCYNPSTFKYTPPAGRYLISAAFSASSSGSLVITGVTIRKNGVAITPAMQATAPNANNGGESSAQIIVDANGSDVFDVVLFCHVANTFGVGYFMATPTQGMVGPQGPPGPLPAGALSLYQEVVLAANANQMSVSWPTGARKIEIEYFTMNAANAADTVAFRAMVNGVPNSTAAYANQYIYGTGATPAAAQLINQTQWQALAGIIFTKGTLKPAVAPAPASQAFIEHAQVGSNATAGYALTAFHWNMGAGMNGMLMFNTSGTMWLPGSFLRVYVVP